MYTYILLGLLIGLVPALILFFVQKRKNTLSAQLSDFNTQLKIENAQLIGELKSIKSLIDKMERESDKTQIINNELLQENGKLFATNESLQNQQKEVLNLELKFKKEFELISHKIIQENTSNFNSTSSQTIKNILEPFKQKIEHFEKDLNEKFINEVKDKTALKTEISKLIELNTKLSDDANNLTHALTGDNKQQGNWGEIILEKVLERSGLEKGIEFVTQKNIQHSGATYIPDAIVFLPDNKNIVIDSKVSLKAYNEMVNSNLKEDQKLALKKHLVSLKNHIKNLSEKGYHEIPSLNTPEFTLLFLPIEASFSATLKADTELFNFGWDRNIIIVSPTTLLATLRTIASIWKHEKQTQHVFEIAKEGGALHDKFVAFIEDFQKIEINIQQSQKSYDLAFNKLSTGKGNIVNRTNKLKNLGAKAKKTLSSELIEKAENSIIQSPSNE
jgi:DNA recombination protein RmuC